MENTKIEWCHHTLNPWRGCQKVSEGCAHCYALAGSKRNPAVLGEWGPGSKRVFATEYYWRLPLTWDRRAQRAGERHRVFCASMADVFEDRPDLALPRLRLFALSAITPHLDWLLLTKSPEVAHRLFTDEAGFPFTDRLEIEILRQRFAAGLPFEHPALCG